MRILTVHNRYQAPGGEDVVFRNEWEILAAAGHSVQGYVRDNREIACGVYARMRLTACTVWSQQSRRALQALLRQDQPDIAHFHNTFPLISPSAYYACQQAGVPVVQTLHNYRLLCPAATFFRVGCVCEQCVECGLWQGVRHNCYRNSLAATAAVATMLAVHRGMRTWSEQVNVYIALTEFARRKFIEGGLPAEKIVVKPNFVHPDPGPREEISDYALFVGRLAPEKGVRTLLSAWRLLRSRIPLCIVGNGSLRPEPEDRATELCAPIFLGHLSREQTMQTIKGARLLVFPSEWYECFPLTLVEAFACGVPVIASRLGAMEEIVADGRTGLHFTPGDPEDLAAKVEWAWTHPAAMAEMGRAARAEYEAKYTAARNYQMLMEIYRGVTKRETGGMNQ
ncbi:MAG TPA: glycosyltransferase family 4 protein [Terriglobia bacterium]|nr:glycosyltransferase family 4 protein [Terriglobia bacterium]